MQLQIQIQKYGVVLLNPPYRERLVAVLRAMNAQALDLVRKLVAADQAPITAKKLIRLTNNANKGTEIVTATKRVCMTVYHVDYHMPISVAYFPLCFPLVFLQGRPLTSTIELRENINTRYNMDFRQYNS